jgi:hypothetical protein
MHNVIQTENAPADLDTKFKTERSFCRGGLFGEFNRLFGGDGLLKPQSIDLFFGTEEVLKIVAQDCLEKDTFIEKRAYTSSGALCSLYQGIRSEMLKVFLEADQATVWLQGSWRRV